MNKAIEQAKKLLKLIKEGKYDFIAHCRCNQCLMAVKKLDKNLQDENLESAADALFQMGKGYGNLSQLSRFATLVQLHMHVVNVQQGSHLEFELPSYIGVRGTIICKFTHSDEELDIATFKDGQQIK